MDRNQIDALATAARLLEEAQAHLRRSEREVAVRMAGELEAVRVGADELARQAHREHAELRRGHPTPDRASHRSLRTAQGETSPPIKIIRRLKIDKSWGPGDLEGALHAAEERHTAAMRTRDSYQRRYPSAFERMVPGTPAFELAAAELRAIREVQKLAREFEQERGCERPSVHRLPGASATERVVLARERFNERARTWAAYRESSTPDRIMEARLGQAGTGGEIYRRFREGQLVRQLAALELQQEQAKARTQEHSRCDPREIGNQGTTQRLARVQDTRQLGRSR